MQQVNFDFGDMLSAILKHHGRLTWPAFKTAIDNLNLSTKNVYSGQEDFQSKHEILRVFHELAHCEYNFGDDSYVFKVNNSFTRLPLAGKPQAVLTGSTNQSTINRIFSISKINSDIRLQIQKQSENIWFAPSRILIKSNDEANLYAFAEELGFSYHDEPSAWRLINYSASLDDLFTRMIQKSRAELNWPRREFSSEKLFFEKKESDDDLRLCSYTNPKTFSRRHLFWNDGVSAEVDRDYGRYIYLSKKNVNILHYDKRKYLFYVPRTVPLPKNISKALVACSGLTPTLKKIKFHKPINEYIDYRVYKAIPVQVVDVLGQKLDQVINDFDSKISEVEEIEC